MAWRERARLRAISWSTAWRSVALSPAATEYQSAKFFGSAPCFNDAIRRSDVSARTLARFRSTARLVIAISPPHQTFGRIGGGDKRLVNYDAGYRPRASIPHPSTAVRRA